MKRFFWAAMASYFLFPFGALAHGLKGHCYDCHTTINSEDGTHIGSTGSFNGPPIFALPIPNLLTFDCIACHSNEPVRDTHTMTLADGNEKPQVIHAGRTDRLSGKISVLGTGGARDKAQNLLAQSTGEKNFRVDTSALQDPPCLPRSLPGAIRTQIDTSNHQKTCGSARGCHGSRPRLLMGP